MFRYWFLWSVLVTTSVQFSSGAPSAVELFPFSMSKTPPQTPSPPAAASPPAPTVRTPKAIPPSAAPSTPPPTRSPPPAAASDPTPPTRPLPPPPPPEASTPPPTRSPPPVAVPVLAPPSPASAPGRIGINYGQLADNLPAPQEVARMISAMTIIGKVRIFNADAGIIKAFANTGIELVIGVNNDQVAALTSPGGAATWVATNVVAHVPASRITMVTVGNEILTGSDMRLAAWLLTAMQNVHAALVEAKLDSLIKVTTPHSLAILGVSFPPSGGAFREDTPELRPLLQFLQQTRSLLLVNAYPYFAYRSSPRDIPLDYALFLPNAGAVDPRTGLVYTNLYTAQVDAVYSAMEKLGYYGVPVAVGESGWPSYGDVSEPGVNVQNAATYVRNLVNYITTESGTPLRPRQPIDTYLFALFNEDLKPGPASERNYGIFRTDGSLMYDCPGLSRAASLKNSSAPSAPTAPSSTTNTKGGGGGAAPVVRAPRESWCIAKANADPASLLRAINYACGVADCLAIQNGGQCFLPNDLRSHASYAFNSYYQKYGHNVWNCNFANTATTTSIDPSYGSCTYLLF